MNGMWAFYSTPMYDFPSSDRKRLRQTVQDIKSASGPGASESRPPTRSKQDLPSAPQTQPPARQPPLPLPLPLPLPPTRPAPPPQHQRLQLHQPVQPHALITHGISHDLLGPAVDGPPSPESIRAFSKQMRRTSVFDKRQSHNTSSSGSSSLHSLTPSGDCRRPSWEHGFESLATNALSRKSSGRSTTSSMMQQQQQQQQQQRDRPESVQIFGKTLFNRRGKLRREPSALSSSGSSIYLPDVPEPMPTPPASALAKETGLNIFGRRRNTSKSEAAVAADAAAAQKKYQISGPYNFQHMTHSNADHAPEVQRASRMGSVSEFNDARGPQPPAQLYAADLARGRHPDDINLSSDFSSEALPTPEEDDEDGFLYRTESYTRAHSTRPPLSMHSQTSPRRTMIQRAQSQDHLRAGVPPPRPPRSPMQPDYAYSPPVPQPQGSNRMSMRFDGSDEFDGRPVTSGGFQYPRPYGPSAEAISPTGTSYGFPSVLDADLSSDYGASSVGSQADDSNWPLPCPSNYENSLPGVPEEEEIGVLSRRDRASVISNSSLRASQSVPLLRQVSLVYSPKSQRPPSGASDTLGRFDLLAAQRALRGALIEREEAEVIARDSWEDDIDWCYEHEAEADCDFAWDRSSLDITRAMGGAESVTPVEHDRQLKPIIETSPAMLNPGQFDMPELSPCSQVSTATVQEAITPTGVLVHKTSNFSLPRTDAVKPRPQTHARDSSDASSFKESHGFTLSPSLLIPADYQQQLMAFEADDRLNLAFPLPYEEPLLSTDKSSLSAYSRGSASTTGSGSMDDRSFSSERHISTISASTDFTRSTMSTSSLDIENFTLKPDLDAVPMPALPPAEESATLLHARAKSHGNLMPILPETEEAPFDQSLLRRGDPTHASDPNLLSLAAGSAAKSKAPLITRRRARTTSLSTPPPPGQYALFPTVQMSGSRI